MKAATAVTKDPLRGGTVIRSALVALAVAVTNFYSVRALCAQSAQGDDMNHHDSGWMSGGWMWVWTVIGVLVVVLLGVVIAMRSKK